MSAAESFTDYSAPQVAIHLNRFFGLVRNKYAQDFAAFVATNGHNHRSYISGLIILAALVGGVAVSWLFFLLMFKCTGQSFGCAAGRPFVTDEELLKNTTSKSGSTDLEDEEEYHDDQSFADDSFQSSIRSSEQEGSRAFEDTLAEREDVASIDSDAPLLPSVREKRTQVSFFIFALIALTCVPLLLVYTYVPLVRATDHSQQYLGETRSIVQAVDESISTIDDTLQTSISLMNSLQIDFFEVCPMVGPDELEENLGVELNALIDIFSSDYTNIEAEVRANIANYSDITESLADMIEGTRNVFDVSREYIWAIPALLLVVCATLAVSVFGVIMSWKGRSSRRLQQLLTYFILPVMIFSTLLLWLLVLSAGAGVILGSDACFQGTTDGSPAQTLIDIMKFENVDPSSLISKQAIDYSHGCQGDNELDAVLRDLETTIQDTIDLIWQYLASVDAAGRSRVIATCGSTDVNVYLSRSRDGAKQLTTLRKSLRLIRTELRCDNVHTIYTDAIEESLCYDVLRALGWGFILLFSLGVTSLAIISMRASWMQRLPEEKIYDEDDVAENMLVDEHEEYLAYISRYRHEWQEYDGVTGAIGTNLPVQGSTMDSGSCMTSHSHTSPKISCGSVSVDSEASESFAEQTFDPYVNSDVSLVSQSTPISFNSLRVHDALLEQKMPAPLLPVNTSDGDSDDATPIPSPTALAGQNSPRRLPQNDPSNPRATDILQNLDKL